MKIPYFTLPQKKRTSLREEVEGFLKTFGMNEEGTRFFLNILTPNEIVMLGRRLKIISALLEGKTFQEISKEFSVGISTVRSVHESLDHQCTSYRNFLEIEKGKAAASKKDLKNTNIPTAWEKQYPHIKSIIKLMKT